MYSAPHWSQKKSFFFSGALEGQHFRKTGNLVSLSEQELVDCDHTNNGCINGYYTRAFDFIRDKDGIDTEQSYPYVGE